MSNIVLCSHSTEAEPDPEQVRWLETEFRCQHKAKPRTATADQRRGSKNTSCPAGLIIVVKVSTFERSDGRVRKLYCRSIGGKA
ncbi:uncharacterized protein LOC121424444 isoform X3 [Lytechinus variegatus]|uniref:uncharacterized protein LOC121424444 isoform X3 n=1 Tax=Lytechinus variegatus TaxID=7654 RepID=UPI001BB1B0C3|nr:uncharacterized protein LOC121424444 isoform X3 [Lytechinus variegatus]